MAGRRFLDPNLARAPFENSRPVTRLSALLWALALVVGGTTYWLTSTARAEAAARRAEIETVTAETAALRESAAQRRAALEAAELDERNLRTRFLNERIAERAFSWNDLFDALGDVLPRGVRIQSLSPQSFLVQPRRTERRPGRARATSASGTAIATDTGGAPGPASTEILLKISGESEENESMLALVDRLFDHQAFRDPNLARESTERDGHVSFSLTVTYVPGWRAATAAAELAAVEGTSDQAGASTSRRAGEGALARGSERAPDRAGEVATGGGTAPGVPAAPAGTAPRDVTAAAKPGAALAAVPPAARGADAGSGRGGTGVDRSAVPSAWGGADAEVEEKLAKERQAADRDPAAGGLRPGERAAPGMLPAPLKPFASPPASLR